jgi:hypothetical protein
MAVLRLWKFSCFVGWFFFLFWNAMGIWKIENVDGQGF